VHLYPECGDGVVVVVMVVMVAIVAIYIKTPNLYQIIVMGVGVEYIPNLAYCLLTVCSLEELLNPVRGP
jgi:hypothetical protein